MEVVQSIQTPSVLLLHGSPFSMLTHATFLVGYHGVTSWHDVISCCYFMSLSDYPKTKRLAPAGLSIFNVDTRHDIMVLFMMLFMMLFTMMLFHDVISCSYMI